MAKIPMKAEEVKANRDPWRVFKVNSERVNGEFYHVEISDYGSSHCTCYSFIYGQREQCKHILFVKEMLKGEKKKENDLFDDLIDIVWDGTAVANGYGGEWTPEYFLRRGNNTREELRERIARFGRELFSRPQVEALKE